MGFQLKAKCCYISYTLNTITGSEFHRVGAATEKAPVTTFALTLGTKSRLELDDRSCLAAVNINMLVVWVKVHAS